MSTLLATKTHQPQPRQRRVAKQPREWLWPLTLDQYHAMIEAGILTDDDPVELLEGWLTYKMPKNPRHSLAVRQARKLLEKVLGDSWFIEPQDAITLSDSEPEPDVVVARGDETTFSQRHPGPQDVVLVVEVADATLRRDRGIKKRMYARAGIPVYWVINLVENVIEVYWAPASTTQQPDYRQQQIYQLADSLPLTIEGKLMGHLQVADLIPPVPPQS